MSPAARQVVCLAGATSSFAESAERVLEVMAGLRQSESTVERVCEAEGAPDRRTPGVPDETVGSKAAWSWHKDAEGKTCAVVSADATGVPQQGPGGKTADGRMVYVGMIYNPVPEECEHGRTRPADGRNFRPGT